MDMRDRFVALVENQQLCDADVIALLQGDGLNRVPHAADLWTRGLAPVIAVVGGANDPAYGSTPSVQIKNALLKRGVPAKAVLFEETGMHTRGEADRIVSLAAEHGWKRILIVTSPHHQYRAFLTFLKAMRDAGLSLDLTNAPAPLSWEEETPQGTRRSLLQGEWERIARYQEKGDVATFADGVSYLS